MKVGIVDLNTNNLFSIYNACKKIGFNTKLINIHENLKKYNCIILPGVGSYGKAMSIINKSKLKHNLLEYSLDNSNKIIGICLGMQLLFEESEEFGKRKGLGLIKGKVKKLKKFKYEKIPNIGWAKIYKNNSKTKIDRKSMLSQYYFVHSYICEPSDINFLGTRSDFGNTSFCSSIFKNNIIGVQFHPEKSGINGISYLKKIIVS